MIVSKLILRQGRERSLERKHPWIFSGAIAQIEGNPNDGDPVEVFDYKGKYLATAHYQKEGSISGRIISFERQLLDSQFWFSKLNSAFRLRNFIGLANSSSTNAYRLVHGEGDGLPGLIIDHYNGVLVVQAHSMGMHLCRNEIAEACKLIYGKSLKAIYYKSSDTLYGKEDKGNEGFLFGEEIAEEIATENHMMFKVNWVTGQKTGFFIDQRENRALLGKMAAGKKVLNTFCYTGGFSISALYGNAALVHSVDSSKKAIELTDENVRLNGFEGNHQSFCSDTLQFMRSSEEMYDMVVLDPPAFAKSVKAKHNAIQGYKRLNTEALKRIPEGGLLFTFSCSQVVDRDLFYHTITSAAIESNRNIRVLQHLGQPADHPVSIFHPEGEYLKGLVLQVE